MNAGVFEGIRAELLRAAGLPLSELMSRALSVKLRERGERFSLCTIMNVKSGRCSEDCAFCAQSSRHRTGAPVYPLRPVDEIIREAEAAKRAGSGRFSIVASGRGPKTAEIDAYCRIVQAVSEKVGIPVCASLGIADAAVLQSLRDAGLARYHHNLETSPRFYPEICSSHGFYERVSTIQAARAVGLEVCSGGIIGLGETREDRIELAATLASLDVASAPINILVPISGTRIYGVPPLPPEEILRTVALFRLALPGKAIRMAGGREGMRDLQAVPFLAGADAMLIGGYLTVRGRAVQEDLRLVEEVQGIWRESFR